MSVQSGFDDTVAEPGRVVAFDPAAPMATYSDRPSWLLPVLIVATTVIVGVVLVFILRDVAAADSVGGCGGG